MNHSADAARSFLRESFDDTDTLAAVLVHCKHGEVLQRISTAGHLASDEFQAWLRERNAAGFEIYVSMNALKDGAKTRTKRDLDHVRHVYLDIDRDGDAALSRVKARPDLPTPNSIFNTSPGKHQVIWRVKDFGIAQAEALQRGLARETGADIAATDATRVLRLPGFLNHKYEPPHRVTIERLSDRIATPGDFPVLAFPERAASDSQVRSVRTGEVSQSERDWAFARRSLSRGEPPAMIAAVIAAYRRFDKSTPQDYAERTVRKAAESMQPSASRSASDDQPNRESIQIER